MSTETNISCSPSSKTRVLPDWMTKKWSPSKNSSSDITSPDLRRSAGVEEASRELAEGPAAVDEPTVEEVDLCQADSRISPQSKAHQLSDDEEEDRIKDEAVNGEQEVACEDRKGAPAADECAEEQGGDGEGEAEAAGEASSQSQNSTASGIQKITWRGLCNYGAKCYRKNPQHKKDYCHPGDEDYDTVFYSLPACPYGARCYRKNKAHWQTNTHPPAARPGKRTRKPATATGTQTVTGSDLDDEYDSADSFLNDASSDDYQPTDSASDSDVSDGDEDAEDGEPDAKRTKKEAKRFLRKKK